MLSLIETNSSGTFEKQHENRDSNSFNATSVPKQVRRVALIGNHSPRQCGIGTFTADLTAAFASKFPLAECFCVAMNDRKEGYAYPEEVRFEIEENELASYIRAARFLNESDVDLVCLQHEYGIFGGDAGSHILTLLRELKMPIVTTLHTILREPNDDQRRVMDELNLLSDRFIVMSQCGSQFLQEVHGVEASRIDVIPHGIPNLPDVSPEFYKKQLNAVGKSVLLTFGLLSPDKGIENVIQALPAILAEFPNVIYAVMGATHPQIRANQGEAYRNSLEALADSLGVRENVHFYNRFATLEELTQCLSAADIYITPYLKPEQITSGTLAYAVGSGKAAISTPYFYAEELLSEGRGILVPWRNPQAIANEVLGLLSNPEKKADIEKSAKDYGANMLWPAVANQFMQTFHQALAQSMASTWRIPKPSTLSPPFTMLPSINLSHLRAMTDDTGMLQHATFNIPNYAEGYCIDDNARALILTTLLEGAGGKNEADAGILSSRYIAFVNHAFNPELGRFRNFMSYDRRWLEEQGAEDSHGRTLWALGVVENRSGNPGRSALAGNLFGLALPAVETFTSPRAFAYTLLGIEAILSDESPNPDLEKMRDLLANRLFQQFEGNSSLDWIWLENSVTYSNARLSQALLVSGRRMGRPEIESMGLRSLRWLVSHQQSEEGFFAPVGSNGFFNRGGTSAGFDQQPVEACAMISACLEAWRITRDSFWLGEARRAFFWFLGCNQLGKSLYDPITGSCCDGIHPDRINANQGAESTLSFLLSLVELYRANRDLVIDRF